MMRGLRAALLIGLIPAALCAQAGEAPPQSRAPGAESQAALPAQSGAAVKKDFITPHIYNSHSLDLPSFSRAHGFVQEVELPRWKPVHIGGVSIDLSPTRHVVMLWIGAAICLALLLLGARGVRTAHAAGRPPKGFSNAIEAMVLYVRNDVILPNVGPHGEAYVNFCLTLFWMVLCLNVLGLIPYAGAASSNISVTATLAILTFIVVEIAGMRTLGKGYISTIVYWPHDMPVPLKSVMTLIMTPVELISKFTKPFALAIRLFANMTAGHVVVLALLGLIFTFGSWWLAPAPLLMATAMMFMELFVAFLQAFIFCLLASVFIGLIRESAH
jgi:F-type H+-transporting ATPase subunit a